MKVFVILQADASRNREAVSLISALVGIMSVENAAGLPQALDAIRRSHPNILVFNDRIFGEKQRDVLVSLLKLGHAVAIVPKNYNMRRKCTSVEVDAALLRGSADADLVIKVIGKIISDNYYENARRGSDARCYMHA
jgi:hypothetical protein